MKMMLKCSREAVRVWVEPFVKDKILSFFVLITRFGNPEINNMKKAKLDIGCVCCQ